MELRVLKYFLNIARCGSFTLAANNLHITQPTLSRQIKELEQEIGHPLFIRKSHSVSLTDEGRRFFKRAEEIMDLVNKTKAEFQTGSDTVSGEIYIGSGESDVMNKIAEIIAELQIKYSKICCHLYSGNAEDVCERLDKGLLDFGVLIQPADLSKYDTLETYIADEWGLIMRKDNPLAQQKYIEKKDLLKLPLICSQQFLNHSANDNFFSMWFGDDFKNLNISATYNLLFNATHLAEKNNCCILGLNKLVDIRNSNLCFRPLFPPLVSKINIIWKKGQIFSPSAQIFADLLQKEFGN